MQYQLKSTILNGTPKAKEDGTYVQNVTVFTKIVGAYENKFIQTDFIDVIIPNTLTLSEASDLITEKATEFVASTYPNT